ncbi:MAG: DNA-processing protein DprA [Clostridia bacterium]|nr:DNA-processing protein DprA [Clostridia bacterium]
MSENTKYWIWLQELGLRRSKTDALISWFGSVEKVYSADSGGYKAVKGINEHDIEQLNNKSLASAEKIIDTIKEMGAYILCIDSTEYPKRLLRLVYPPYVLYVKGSLRLNEPEIMIGVVGTRKCNDYGVSVTKTLSASLAEVGVVIVSGMARGIDTHAAVSAMNVGGKTIAVLGCGLDVVYPPENTEVMNAIMQNGVVITEYPPGSPADKTHFPVRNRIIAGLSDGLLVTQAPIKSGALITARHAMDMGIKVFGVMGSIFDPMCRGSNNIIKRGAEPVTSAHDITDVFALELKRTDKPVQPEKDIVKYPIRTYRKDIISAPQEESKPKVSINDKRFDEYGAEDRKILEIIIDKNRASVDEIIRISELPTAFVNASLSLMELMGEVKHFPGNYYELS